MYHFETFLKGPGRNAVEMANNAKDFITAKGDKPFFLYFATTDPHRGGGKDKTSTRELKPDLFGNLPRKGGHKGVEEVFFEPAKVPIPPFLPDTPETREELAQYYQSCSRIDQGLGRLVEILKEAGIYDKTLIVFTADHGMAFSGGKTTVYEGGLRVPFVVRNPYEAKRGIESQAMISHIDITPSLLDFVGGLDEENSPKKWVNPKDFWKGKAHVARENRSGGHTFRNYHGKSWVPILGKPDGEHWQAQYRKSMSAPYGTKTVGQYIQRPKFELYDIANDPNESKNLAGDPESAELLTEYQDKLKAFQKRMDDPWIMKWDYE